MNISGLVQLKPIKMLATMGAAFAGAFAISYKLTNRNVGTELAKAG